MRMPVPLLVLWLALSSVSVQGVPPAAQTSPELQRANDLYAASDWAGAAAAYEAIAKQTPDAPAPHFRLAVALMALGRHAEAIPHLQQAEKLGSPPVPIALRLAAAYAHTKQRDLAFAQLQRATGMGLGTVPPPLDRDPDLLALAGDPRYAEFRAAMDRNVRPCEHDALYRQLDFWLGAWDVLAANAPPNTPPASSVITKIHNGCVILESWTAPGQTGQSFNIYDRSMKKWHQTWVDSTGGLHEYWGSLQEGNMVYEGDLPAPPGMTGRMHTRLTFFNLGPGRVRQLSERSGDGGKTWQVNYDLLYTRRTK
jgi:tetratricopeptide (TPR) repeat protein